MENMYDFCVLIRSYYRIKNIEPNTSSSKLIVWCLLLGIIKVDEGL